MVRYRTKVHARNRNSDYGIPVTVYAENRKAAATRAIAVGWSGDPSDALVTFLDVEEMPPTTDTGGEGRSDG